MPVMRRGIAALAVAGMLTCSMPQPAHAQAAEIIADILDAIITILGSHAVQQLFLPAPQNLAPGPNNTAVGFQSQPCSSDNGFNSTVEGGAGLPCAPNAFTPFGAGLYIRQHLSPDDCAYLNAVGGAALRNAVIPNTTMSVEFLQTEQPLSGVAFPNVGAVCSPTTAIKYTAIGFVMSHDILLYQEVASKDECAYLYNLSTSRFSCDGYYRPN